MLLDVTGEGLLAIVAVHLTGAGELRGDEVLAIGESVLLVNHDEARRTLPHLVYPVVHPGLGAVDGHTDLGVIDQGEDLAAVLRVQGDILGPLS